MKKSILAIAAVALMAGFTSCNKDNSATEVDNAGASISIKMSNEVIQGTRGFDNLTGLNQDVVAITDVNVFIISEAGAILHSDNPTLAEMTAGKEYKNSDHSKITKAAKEVIIVGNVGTIPASVKTKEQLQAIVNSLVNAYTDKATKVWVYGASNITWGAAVAGVEKGNVNIQVNPMLVRIDATVDCSLATNGLTHVAGHAKKNVTFDGVSVLYSAAGTHYIPSMIPTTTELTAASIAKPMVSGLDASSNTAWASLASSQANVYAALKKAWSVEANGKFEQSFYAFPTDLSKGYERNTVITVYGKRKNADNSETTLFWPIHFATDGNGGQELVNGNIYTVTFTMKGDFSNGGGGITDPEEKKPADITVKVTSAQWKAKIAINVPFEE